MNDLATIADFLRAHSTLTLATVSGDGTPYATPLFYVLDENLQLYWLSSGSSTHSMHLAVRSDVSAAVYSETDEWEKIRGVQLWGTASVVQQSNLRKEVVKAYTERFRLGSIFRLAIVACNLYRLAPMRVRYLDNSKHFGYKRELILPRQGEPAV